MNESTKHIQIPHENITPDLRVEHESWLEIHRQWHHPNHGFILFLVSLPTSNGV